MRIRTIKPSFWTNDELAELDALTRLLFIGLWGLADVRGRLEDRPKRIKAAILPYDSHDIEKALSQLAVAGFIVRYTAKGVPVIQVNSFEKHQRITGKEAETDSDFPGPSDPGSKVRQGKQRGSTGEAPGSPEGKEGKEGEGEGGPPSAGSWDSPKPARKRNEILDALVACCGGDPLQTTKAGWSQAATALSDIRQVAPDVTADTIREKAAAYRKAHPDWELTTSALAKHWGTLANATSASPDWVMAEMAAWARTEKPLMRPGIDDL